MREKRRKWNGNIRRCRRVSPFFQPLQLQQSTFSFQGGLMHRRLGIRNAGFIELLLKGI
jgi:hypothetical protein